MPRRREDILKQSRERIAAIRASLNAVDYLCSGTLSRRMMRCGSRPAAVPTILMLDTARTTSGDT